MNNRVKQHALTVMTYAPEGTGNFIPVFVYYGEPFVGIVIIHKILLNIIKTQGQQRYNNVKTGIAKGNAVSL